MPKLEKEGQGGVTDKKNWSKRKDIFENFWDQSIHFLRFIEEKTDANKVDMCLFLKSDIKIKSLLVFIWIIGWLFLPFLKTLEKSSVELI